MEKMNYGWCRHVPAWGFYTAQGGTVLRISPGCDVILRWVSKTECLVFCQLCYDRSFGSLIQLRQDPTQFVNQQDEIRHSPSPISARVGGDDLPWSNDERVSQSTQESN